YGYVGDDPINGWDPLGLEEIIRSPTWMRVAIPGQAAWDDAQTHWHNGRYGYATASSVLMLAEQVVAVLTFGESMAARQGTSCAVRQAESSVVEAFDGVTSHELSNLTSKVAKDWIKGASDIVPCKADLLRLKEIARRAVEAGKQSTTNPVQSQRLQKIEEALRKL
ncbi:MAG: hypothetical protein NTZ94_18500, partial [Verrucomicrobia bacterium]|nr:hypothetical protein [Verrucomicrobiota bacterium]